MRNKRLVLVLLIGCLGGLLFAGGSQANTPSPAQSTAQEVMKYGDLLPGFVDTNGDLVADVPADSSKIIDPNVLIFSYTPVEDPEVYRGVWSDFIDHLARVTGKQIQFFPVQNNAAQLEALRSGRIHIAGVNTGSVPMAVNTAGLVPFTIMASADGSFGYEMEVITRQDSTIQVMTDIKGRQLAFVSPTSNSGFKAPSAILSAEFGLEPDKDFTTAFSGNHDTSILGVLNGDYEAAAIANSVMSRMVARGLVDQNQIRTIYKSATFPTTGYGYLHTLSPDLADKIKEAFFTFEWAGTSLEVEFSKSGEAQFIPITYQEHWEVIRTIDKATGVVYQ